MNEDGSAKQTKNHQDVDGETTRLELARCHIEETDEIDLQMLQMTETDVTANTEIAHVLETVESAHIGIVQDLRLLRSVERGREADLSRQRKCQCKDLVLLYRHKTILSEAKLLQEKRHHLRSRSQTSNLQVSLPRKQIRSQGRLRC